MRCFLVDNGSLRVDSWCNLCRVASAVTAKSGIRVEPASVLHSSRIDNARVPPGIPRPQTWEQAVKRALEEGERSFWTIPFFIGPSGAITEYLPSRETALHRRFGAFSVRYGPFLANGGPGESPGFVDLVVSRVKETLAENALRRPSIVLVDHGSPRREVTAVRDRMAAALASRLGDSAKSVRAASMERRAGAEYAFNDPLLESILRDAPFDRGDVVVALLFLSPGRHAGEGGDIATICANAEANRADLRTFRTRLLGDHPAMPGLVASRLAQMMETS